MGLSPDMLVPGAALPRAVPWPAGAAPTPAPLAKAPATSDDLSRFKGYDAVVVTWTAAEASAMATLFTPGRPLAEWYEYRHKVASYEPLVTGSKAPFNDRSSEMARYYHSLGLYFPCTIRGQRVLLFKSGLHLDYDGPAYPVRKLMAEIAQAVAPKAYTRGIAFGKIACKEGREGFWEGLDLGWRPQGWRGFQGYFRRLRIRARGMLVGTTCVSCW